MIDLLLHAVIDQQTVDLDLVRSACISLQTQSTVRRLLVDHRIPVWVKHDDFGCSGQVQTKPADLGRHEEHEDVLALRETLNDRWPVRVLDAPVQPRISIGLLAALLLDDVKHRRSLAEKQHSLLVFPLMQEAKQDLQLCRLLDAAQALLREAGGFVLQLPFVVLVRLVPSQHLVSVRLFA